MIRRKKAVGFFLVLFLSAIVLIFMSAPVKVANIQVSPGNNLNTSSAIVIGVISPDVFLIDGEKVSKEKLNEMLLNSFFTEKYSGILLIFDNSISSQEIAGVKKWFASNVPADYNIITSVVN